MPETQIQTNNPSFDEFYPRIKKFMHADVSEFVFDGKLGRGYRSADSLYSSSPPPFGGTSRQLPTGN